MGMARSSTCASGSPAGRQELDQLAAAQVLHRDEVAAASSLDGVDDDDVRVLEGGEGAGLAFEAGEPLGIGGDLVEQHLEGDLAP